MKNKTTKLLIPTALMMGLFLYAYYFYKTETKENFAGENEYRIGSALIENKEYNKAITHLNKSLEINPDIEAAFLSKGIALMMMNKFDESKKNFDKAISMKKNFAEAYANRGILNDKTGNYKEAIEDYRKAAKLKPKLLEGPGRIWKFLRNIHFFPFHLSKTINRL